MIRKLHPATSSTKWYVIPLLFIPYLLSFLVAGLIRLFRSTFSKKEIRIPTDEKVDADLQEVINKHEPLASGVDFAHP
ncbi:MAG: hypothetical protein AAFP02_09910 [Bacteroidota bacterium]